MMNMNWSAVASVNARQAGEQAPHVYHVLHETIYDYQYNVSLSQQLLHMTPRTFEFQETLAHKIEVFPKPNDRFKRKNYFGNFSKTIMITSLHKSLRVQAESTVRLMPRLRLDQINHSMPWEGKRAYLEQITTPQAREIAQYLYESPHVSCSPELADYAAPSFTAGRPLLDAALDLTYRIFRDFKFDGSATTISTPLTEVLQLRRGVCQDFAHLMIGCLRTLGIAARYVSGYILTTPPPGQPRMIGCDASHAWVSVYCEGYGWVDFDPTNHCLVQHEHITVGWGRDFSDVTPMRGVILGGGDQILTVNVTVTPLEGEFDAGGLPISNSAA